MSRTRAERIYRRWTRYQATCTKIGGSPGNRVPDATYRAALTLYQLSRKPYPAWPAQLLTEAGRAEAYLTVRPT